MDQDWMDNFCKYQVHGGMIDREVHEASPTKIELHTFPHSTSLLSVKNTLRLVDFSCDWYCNYHLLALLLLPLLLALLHFLLHWHWHWHWGDRCRGGRSGHGGRCGPNGVDHHHFRGGGEGARRWQWSSSIGGGGSSGSSRLVVADEDRWSRVLLP